MMSEIRRLMLIVPLFFGCFLLFSLESARAVEQKKSSGLEYQWDSNFKYYCRYKVTATILQTKKSIQGTTIYSPFPPNMASALRKTPKPETKKCTGTAFVVSPGGILATCFHVVEGATKIEAIFGEKKYAAEVIAYDIDHDLALLKVEPRNLPSLKFLDSEKVELAQEIRVVGYPLSNVLGESVKMSRGTISGIIRREDDRRFQIDARVNPGNSGGPLVDEQGRVVGVASELLVNGEIDSIGFAIPSNEVITLMREKDIRVQQAADAAELKGPELAKRVTPSVALLRVESGPGGIAEHKQHMLIFSGWCQDTATLNTRSSHATGEVHVDSCGKVISSQGGGIVPFTFESMATIGIEQLPGDDRKSWKSFRFVTLGTATESRSNSGSLPYSLRPPSYHSRYRSPYLPRYRPPSRYGLPREDLFPPSPYGQREKTAVVKLIPAIEAVQYERTAGVLRNGPVSISKKYRLHSVEKVGDGKHALDFTSEGKLLWDPKIGCVKQSHMKGQISLNQENAMLRIPVEFKYEVTKKTKPPPKKTIPPKPTLRTTTPRKETPKPPPVRKIGPSTESERRLPSSRKKDEPKSGLSRFDPDA